MNGKDLLRRHRSLLNEASDSRFLNRRQSFDYLYAAAREFVRVTQCLASYQDITTVKDQAAYTLNGDFMGLYLQDPDTMEFFIRYYDGTSYSWIYFRDYSFIVTNNSLSSVSIPTYFTIKEKGSAESTFSGTATADGTHSGGKARLTDSAAAFSSLITPGDPVCNTTQGTDGVVLAVASGTGLDTALFTSANVEASWTSADAYVVTPRGKLQIILDPPPSTAGHTARVYYLQKPAPVYSDYDIYRIPYDYEDALPFYAAWLYKYKDKEPNFGDAFYTNWLAEVQRSAHQIEKMHARRLEIIPGGKYRR